MPNKIRREESALYGRHSLDYIREAAEHGLYEIRGMGAKRSVPSFDDLVFLTASATRYPLEGYRERCVSKTVLGTRAKNPIELETPVTIAGMSFGALSANVKEAIGRAATESGTSTTTGDGGMTPEERQSSKTLVYQCLPSRYGFNPDDLRKADAIVIHEIKSAGLYRNTAQAFAVLLPVQSVGVMGDDRTYDNAIAVRCVDSEDFMTADWTHLPYDLLARISNRIINEVAGVNRVVYDISSKPPATIEWE